MTPTFLIPPTHYALDEFQAMLAKLKFGSWRPRFPTLHNTGVPSLKQWLAMGATPQERWGGNLNRYYQGMGWHAGPHLVVCPSYVWVLCDLTKSGVSVSCWNSETFGIEMVGNYEVGGDDFASGDGARVRDNAAAALAAVAEVFAWGDLADISIGARGLHFHHDCVADHHACPGSKVTKPDVLARVKSLRGSVSVGAAPAPSRPAPASNEPATAPRIVSVDDIQAALNRLGAHPQLVVDGENGPATVAAVKAFQRCHHCFPDGWAGTETCAAIETAIAGPVERAA